MMAKKKKNQSIGKQLCGAIRRAILASKTGDYTGLYTRVADDTVKQKNRRDRKKSKNNLRQHEG